jgi:hypothetical protein
LRRLQHGWNKGELPLTASHRFDYAEILNERQREKSIITLAFLPLAAGAYHVAIEAVRAWVGAGRDGRGIHHRGGWIDGAVVRNA